MGRQYSDDEEEDQYFYDRSSELMATELASERKSKSEPVKKMMRAAPKVCTCTVISLVPRSPLAAFFTAVEFHRGGLGTRLYCYTKV